MRRFDLRRYRTVIFSVLGGLLLLNLLILFFFTAPRLESARTADETTAALETAVMREVNRVELLDERVQQMQHSQEVLERFFKEDLATKKERLVAIQKEIFEIARTFQVDAAQLKFSHEAVSGTNMVQLAVSIPLTGGYKNLRQFISKVESSELFLIIQSVQLQEGEQGGSLLNLNVRLATYFAVEDNERLRRRWNG